jgi:YjbR
MKHQLSSADFRRIALGLKDTIESAHMGHPDFRVGGRIFATLHADLEWGMVKLTPDQQQEFVQNHPEAFKPENGAWGRQGCTAVRLDAIDEETLGEALTLARANTEASPKPVARRAKAGG